jgi:hypothetical protein
MHPLPLDNELRHKQTKGRVRTVQEVGLYPEGKMNKLLLCLAVVVVCAQVLPAGVITYGALLTGAESGSPGTGSATVIIDDIAQTMEIEVDFAGLLGTTTASHIHCCTAVAGTGTAGVATQTPQFIGFPDGVTNGSYDHTFDLTLPSTYNASFVTAQGGLANAEAALLNGLATDHTYLNVHTSFAPGGEISGFLVATPEPSTILLATGALLGLGVLRRRKA